MDPTQAITYGLIDKVVTSDKLQARQMTAKKVPVIAK
jgi:ATP-dependent protease ClpP protease subunit